MDPDWIPRNWGKIPYEQKYPAYASASNALLDQPPLIPALRDKEVLHEDPGGTPYREFLDTISVPAWSTPPGRKSAVLACVLRRYTRLSIKGFSYHLKNGTTHGVLKTVEVYKLRHKIVLESSEKEKQSMIDMFLEYIKPVLGDDEENEELQHFYEMIKKSTRENFWMIQHHPILMGIQLRYTFPANIPLWLKCFAGWEDEFDRSFPDDIDIYSKIKNSVLFDVYQMHNSACPKKGFVSRYLGLIRLSNALNMHGADVNRIIPLTPEVVERELSSRFPMLLPVVFQFLFLVMSIRYPMDFLKEIDDSY